MDADLAALPGEPSAGTGALIVALVVDLDGTLIQTDLLFEAANLFVTRRPLEAPRLAGWLAQGKQHLKSKLAAAITVDAASLPYKEHVIAWLREQRASGRRLVLATASHRSLAESVAAHLGLFDEVLATDGEFNLRGRHKRDLLVRRFGEKQFDYVGDHAIDLEVWRSSRHAYVVTRSSSLVSRVREVADVRAVFPDGGTPFARAVVRALRPHQWVKNLLILVPLLAAHRYWDFESVVAVFMGLVVFGLTASSVYVLNDLVDVMDDRQHVRKRTRPFAAGDLGLHVGWMLWPALLVAAFAVAVLTLPTKFVGVLSAYFVLTFAYSLRLKRVPIIDVLTLASLYTIRIIAGAAAIGVPLSFWLLSFSMFFFLSLAFVKRFSELYDMRASGKSGRIRGRGYVKEDLEVVSAQGTASGYISVLVLALYIQDSHTAELYSRPQLIWLACPILLYWISRAWLIAHRGDMHDDPVVFALRDRISWAIGAGVIGVFALARTLS